MVDTLIGRLMRGRADLQPVLDKIKSKAEGAGASAAAPADAAGEPAPADKKPYEFQLFNITQPRPRMLPEPFSIPVGFKANPVPSSVLQPSALQSKVAEKCKEARDETIARHKTYSAFNFTERPMEIDRLREEAAQREEEATRYIAPKVNPPPNIPPEKQEKVRLNAAAILREDALLKKKQQQEAQSLLKYESELRDASQFEAWKAQMLSKDEEERQALIEKRRVEMIMTDAAAREARERAVLENKALAASVTKEILAGFEEADKLQRAELEKKKEVVKKVQEGEASAGIGKEKLVGVRLEAAQKQKEQIREQLIAAEKEREKEREVRMDLVRQIRALSIVPPRITDFDPTDTPEHGLLDQMSIAELKERLAFVRQEDEELRQEKRAAIILAKQQKERELMAKVESIARVRDLASKESVAKKSNRLTSEKEASEKIRLKREAQMEELQQKIEKQRTARLSEAAALEEEMRQIRIKKQFLAAGASQMEEKKWMEIEKGAERAIVDRVQDRSVSEAARAHALGEDEANRTKHYRDIEAQREQFAKQYEVKVKQKREIAEKDSAAELEHKATLALAQKQFEVIKPCDFRALMLRASPPFVLQSTLHQKLMSSKANTYYSDLKVQALRSTRALNAPHLLILASQAATIDKGRTSFVAKK